MKQRSNQLKAQIPKEVHKEFLKFLKDINYTSPDGDGNPTKHCTGCIHQEVYSCLLINGECINSKTKPNYKRKNTLSDTEAWLLRFYKRNPNG